jgi:hypothetical protein
MKIAFFVVKTLLTTSENTKTRTSSREKCKVVYKCVTTAEWNVLYFRKTRDGGRFKDYVTTKYRHELEVLNLTSSKNITRKTPFFSCSDVLRFCIITQSRNHIIYTGNTQYNSHVNRRKATRNNYFT